MAHVCQHCVTTCFAYSVCLVLHTLLTQFTFLIYVNNATALFVSVAGIFCSVDYSAFHLH